MIKKIVKKKKISKKKVPDKKSVNININMPDERTEISENLEDYIWLIYGERKIGKTTLFSEFKNTIFVMFDPLQKGLRVRQIHCPSWKHFLKFLDKLEERLKTDPDYCSMLIIDTGYMAYERCFSYKVAELGIDDPQDRAWGSGWKQIAREFMEAHERIFELGLGLGVTAHSELKEVRRRDGSTYDKLTTQLGGQAFKYYNGLVDVIAYYQYDLGGRRELSIYGDQNVEAGTRIEEHFKFSDGTPIKNIPMGKSHKESYRNLLKAFNNELKKEVKKKKVFKQK